MLSEFRISLEVDAPLDRVWKSLVDWKSQGEWMAMTHVDSSHIGAADSGVGTTIEAFTGIGKFGILDQMRVTEWKPPHRCVVDHFGPIIKGIGIFELSAIDDNRTRFDWFERVDAPKVILALIKPGILLAVRYSLRRFARFTAVK